MPELGASEAIVAVLWMLYFVPTAVAVIRHKSNKIAIGLLNLFAGWTVIGWIAALIWASSAERITGSQPAR